MIKAVIFDIDGVLLDSLQSNLKFFQDIMVYSGYQPPTLERYRSLFHLTMRDAIKELTGLSSEDEIRKIWEIGRNRLVRYPIELQAAPEGLEEVIRGLNRNYLLGIVTSRVRNGIYEHPELIKIKECFQVAVSSEDVAHPKPHPESLLLAAQKLEVKPEEAVYIGDVDNDIQAARAAGMKVIIYSPEQIVGADARTAIFKDLPGLINNL